MTNRPTFDFSGRACRWIDGDPRDPGCRQCSEKPAPGKSFCAAHHALAFKSAKNADVTDPWAKAAPVDAEAA